MLLPPKTLVIGLGLLLFGVLEQWMPFFKPSRKPLRNLSLNFGLGLFNAIAISSSILFLLNAGWNYRSAHPELPSISNGFAPIAAILSFLLLDLYLYLWHRAMHRWGWAIHRLHHTDRHLNLSTAYRFNPIEVLLSQLLRIPLILLVGITPIQLLIYEICFSLSLIFHHSNWSLPKTIDRPLSRLIITPNLHRLHHSHESDSPSETVCERHPCNFSSLLTLWDFIGQTYQYPRSPQHLKTGTRS
jgi:sterol desaturase/sphingolipid hydroxylase (fatty acid hydroxylase superfamily)